MSKSLFISRIPGMTWVAATTGGKLLRLWIEKDQMPDLTNAIFWARVRKLNPAIDGAFLDLGEGRSGLLNRRDIPATLAGSEHAGIGSILREGRSLLVQVKKTGFDHKQMQVTADFRFIGSVLVYAPMDRGIGFSRRFRGPREVFSQLLAGLVPDPGSAAATPLPGGWVVRSGASGMEEAAVAAEARELGRRFREIENGQTGPPRLLQRDAFLETLLREQSVDPPGRIYVDDERLYEDLRAMTTVQWPHLLPTLSLHQGAHSLFDTYRVESEIAAATAPKVWLKSGGYLEIHPTEALTVIDVNSGKHTRARAKLSPRQRTNLEAVEELCRQIQIRNLAGLIVVDFIDPPSAGERREIENLLGLKLEADPLKTKMLPMNPFGLIVLTRARTRLDLNRVLREPCPRCQGSGWVDRPETVAARVQRALLRDGSSLKGSQVAVCCAPRLAKYLERNQHLLLKEIASFLECRLHIEVRVGMNEEEFEIELR